MDKFIVVETADVGITFGRVSGKRSLRAEMIIGVESATVPGYVKIGYAPETGYKTITACGTVEGIIGQIHLALRP